MEELLREKWNSILQTMKMEYDIADVAFKTWIMPLKIHHVEDNLITLVSSELQMGIKIIEKKYSSLLKVSISEAVGQEVDVKIISEVDANKNVFVPKKSSYQAFNLNPKYTFDTFVVGDNNRHAHAVSLAVAESPGAIYNPLFLYGGVGLGKTHLMHAIAHFIIANNSEELKVLYVTSEDFTNELIESLKNQKTTNSEFREKYRNIDVLLIDDIQFIIGKESTQEEFFHTFNTLYQSGKQIIISSDRPPKEMETLNERLISRFEMGALTDIQMPTYETKMAILSKKEEVEHFTVPNEVKSFIANNINSSIRQLEGALTNLVSYARISHSDITVELAENVLKDIISPDSKKKQITPDDIINVVSEHFGVTPEDIISQKRNAKLVNARHITMYLCRTITSIPLTSIGDLIGKRDHTTVGYAVEKIENEISTNPTLASTIDVLKKKLNSN